MGSWRACLLWLLVLGSLGLPRLLLAQNQLINGGLIVVGPINGCEDVGSTDAYACAFDPAISEYNLNSVYLFKANTPNTGPATLNINGVGAVTIKKVPGGIATDLVTGDICTGQRVMVVYDGANMQMLSQSCTVATGTVTVGGTPTAQQLAVWLSPTQIGGTSTLSLNITDLDLAAATSTRPTKTGTTPPGPPCRDGDLFWDSDATAGARLLDCHTNVWTPQGGGTVTPGGVAGRASYSVGGTTVDDSTGHTYDGSDVLTVSPKVTAIAANTTAGAHNVLACTSGTGTIVVTLPTTATAPAKQYSLVKVDTGSGLCRFAPAAGEQLNWVVNGTQDVLSRGDSVTVTLIAAGVWHAQAGATATALAAALDALPRGRSLYIPAGAMDVSGACALNASAVLLTNGPKLPTISCTDADTDAIEFDFVMPDGWNGGTLTLELAVFYTGTTHNTQVFDMNFSGQCVSHGDAVAAYAITSGATAESTTNVQALVTASGTANRELHGTTDTPQPLTLAGTCAPGDHVYLHGLVDAGGTTFTPMADLKILGVKVEWTRNAND